MSKMQSPPHSSSPGQRPTQFYPPESNPGLFPPWWSILLTLLMVIFCAVSLIFAVVALGGNTAPAEPPYLVILTAAPVETFVPAAMVVVTQTLPPASEQAQNPVSFVMSGPTLPPPAITPTAISIAIGATVRVVDVGDEQLNVRERAGVQGVDVKFRAPENTLFTVVDGPTQADGLTWWRIQDPENSAHNGWAASNYLEVIPTEAVSPEAP